jgi:hypothetical protein
MPYPLGYPKMPSEPEPERVQRSREGDRSRGDRGRAARGDPPAVATPRYSESSTGRKYRPCR